MIVVADVLAEFFLQLINAGKALQIEALRFKCAEEAFHGGIVEAISSPRHALRNSMLSKGSSIGVHLILPPLV